MKAIKFIILAVLAGSMFFGCKKGDNDPFLSFSSRKARLCGEWLLADGSITKTSASSTETVTYTESTQATFDGTTTTTVPYTESFTFEKDGTYKYSSNEDGDTYDETGAWTFGSANKELDVKSKETVTMYCESYTSTFMGTSYTYQYNGTNCPVYHITLDMLKSKKMTVLTDYTYTGETNSYTKTGTMNYEKQ
jgi:hypothetical protein